MDPEDLSMKYFGPYSIFMDFGSWDIPLPMPNSHDIETIVVLFSFDNYKVLHGYCYNNLMLRFQAMTSSERNLRHNEIFIASNYFTFDPSDSLTNL